MTTNLGTACREEISLNEDFYTCDRTEPLELDILPIDDFILAQIVPFGYPRAHDSYMDHLNT